jgi:hypothetical protein
MYDGDLETLPAQALQHVVVGTSILDVRLQSCTCRSGCVLSLDLGCKHCQAGLSFTAQPDAIASRQACTYR